MTRELVSRMLAGRPACTCGEVLHRGRWLASCPVRALHEHARDRVAVPDVGYPPDYIYDPAEDWP